MAVRQCDMGQLQRHHYHRLQNAMPVLFALMAVAAQPLIPFRLQVWQDSDSKPSPARLLSDW